MLRAILSGVVCGIVLQLMDIHILDHPWKFAICVLMVAVFNIVNDN